MNYGYDQLNRLKYQQGFTMSGNTASSIDAYAMDLNYDGNGNIINLLRTGRSGNLNLDKLSYRYYDANNAEIPNMANPPTNATNRLASVRDVAPAGNYPESGSPLNGTVTDIDNQGSNNYTYDAIGNLLTDNAEGILGIKWNLQNKIAEIKKTDGHIFFAYDALGNRVSKKYVPATGIAVETYYVRDASGNIMSVYEYKSNNLRWKEQELDGNGRLGIWEANEPMTAQVDWNGTVDWQNMQLHDLTTDSLLRGSKRYELTNHLGNVLATVSDRRIQAAATISGTSGVTADLVTVTDYYAFGMQMPGRSVSGGNYRFGFNGKENDNEVKGNGNQQDYGLRIYDPRIAKFLSVDPLTKNYPWYTPYQFAGNKPIQFIDLDGGEEKEKTTSIPAPKNGDADALPKAKKTQKSNDADALPKVKKAEVPVQDYKPLKIKQELAVKDGVKIKPFIVRTGDTKSTTEPKATGTTKTLNTIKDLAGSAGDVTGVSEVEVKVKGVPVLEVITISVDVINVLKEPEGSVMREDAINTMAKDGVLIGIGYIYPVAGLGIAAGTALNEMANSPEMHRSVSNNLYQISQRSGNYKDWKASRDYNQKHGLYHVNPNAKVGPGR